jgi:hypothetical protein
MEYISTNAAADFVHELATATDLRHLLGLRAIVFSEAVLTDKLFFLNVEGECLYPKFFADHAIALNDIETVCLDLRSMGSLAKFHFFRNPHALLGGRSPLEALAEGLLAEARHAASLASAALRSN